MFTTDGALVGYDSRNLYDLSPRLDSPVHLSFRELSNKTIYSATRLTVLPDAASRLKKGDQVILKGQDIRIPARFHWPYGSILRIQTVPARP
jgi:hypothetical protein